MRRHAGELRCGPRERIRAGGAEILSDEELVSLMLSTGARGQPVSVLSAGLLSWAGGLRGLAKLNVGALAARPGLGVSKACRIVAALELGRRLVAMPWVVGRPLSCSRDVQRALGPKLAPELRERFLAIALDAKNRPMAEIAVAVGGLTACPVAPSDIFRALIAEGAHATILVHNHPSGVPSPSHEDIALTDRLWRAGELLGVTVLDHVIVAREGYFSFRDVGLLPPTGSRESAA
jgi:DNA repair protein RadC